ncbi:IS3 family transposase [Stenotrophomonas sp. ZAC14A_NAIMI4_1]|uniref:IS3 family transposase n=2 Tax=Stenotrophomonas sp. ZAC14A_NAIMI4_1 TaxID=2072412 RepID=UPI0020B128D6|nr:IS3 family transposase [Stenotrophomonas sp. ZAC14A_NAIMI4_1]
MKSTIRRSQRDYSLAFKLSVVDQVERGELTYKKAQERYGIQGRSTVLSWLRRHGRQDWSGGASFPSMSTVPKAGAAKPLTPEQQIKALQVQLREANEKAQLFEAIVDVLKEDYGVKIGKKAFRQVLTQRRLKGVSVARACRHFGISRQAFYQAGHRHQRRGAANATALALVNDCRARQPRIGTRKLHHLIEPKLQAAGIDLGRDRLFDVLREARLLVPQRRAYHKTTDSHHRFRKHPNLLKPGENCVVPNGCEQVWVADITYLPTDGKFVYLSLVTDAWSRKIVGWSVNETLQTEHTAQALEMALKARKTRQRLIHHSDRGIQYCSDNYQHIHAKHGLVCSMTDGYDCYQNALAERVNGILKCEFLLHRPRDLGQARQMVAEAVEIYNAERPHLSLKMQTPDAMHRASLAA